MSVTNPQERGGVGIMSLDEKLKEILASQQYLDGDISLDPENVNKGIAQIKQAFADEGYMDNKFSVWTPDKKLKPQTPEQKAYADKIFKDAVPYMTGQKWYDRFWSIYNEDRLPAVVDATIIRQQVDAVAKRAAGIDT